MIVPDASATDDVDPGKFDLIVLGMQEAQYGSPGVRELMGRVAKSGGAVEVLASGQKTPRGLTIAGGFLYWGNHTGGSLHRLRL